MAIGTASVILVVTISLTSRDYILEQVQGIGSNIIFAFHFPAFNFGRLPEDVRRLVPRDLHGVGLIHPAGTYPG